MSWVLLRQSCTQHACGGAGYSTALSVLIQLPRRGPWWHGAWAKKTFPMSGSLQHHIFDDYSNLVENPVDSFRSAKVNDPRQSNQVAGTNWHRWGSNQQPSVQIAVQSLYQLSYPWVWYGMHHHGPACIAFLCFPLLSSPWVYLWGHFVKTWVSPF